MDTPKTILLALICSMPLLAKGTEYSGPHTPLVNFGGYQRFTSNYLSRAARQASVAENMTIEDHHIYYRSSYIQPGTQANSLWRDLTRTSNVISGLSNLFRHYQVLRLAFDFPYYGHLVNAVGVTTGGFLYTGTFFHRQVQLTQNIAPLQADFNPSINDTARILIHNASNVFTVQWDGMHNHDHVEAGPFTFQVSLFPSGVIHFVYKEIPLLINQINNDDHPVEVGVSDSFYVDVNFANSFGGSVIVRTVYEYSRIQLNSTNNLTYSAYILTPVPNCIQAGSCDECIQVSSSSDFQCGWCDNLRRCSDGLDRHRQEWFQSGCVDSATNTCEPPSPPPSPSPSSPFSPFPSPKLTPSISPPSMVLSPLGMLLSPGGAIGVAFGGLILVIVLLAVAGCACILVYGYRHPTSRIGLYMIEHRPKAKNLNKEPTSYNVESGKTILDEKE